MPIAAIRERPISASRALWLPRAASVMPVRWAPGNTVVTPMPVVTSSARSASEKERTAPLVSA